MDVAIQRQLGQCTLEELIQIAIHLIFEIQYRLERVNQRVQLALSQTMMMTSNLYGIY